MNAATIRANIAATTNLRYEDCHGRYFANFDPACTAYRERLQPWQPAARFFGVIKLRERRLSMPLFDRKDPNADNKKKPDDSQYKAAIERLPDKKFDPWANMR